MPRVIQKLISAFAITALLFTQLAVSAYACPMQFAAMESDAIAENIPPRTEPAPATAIDCDDMDMNMDMSQLGLCQHHCKNEQQNVSDTPLDLAPLTVASSRIVALFEPPTLTLLALATHVSTPSLHHATSPASSIQHCCFRI